MSIHPIKQKASMRLSFLPVLGLLMGLSMSLAHGQTARLQFIHNVADPERDTIDVYIDDSLYADNLTFREATPFLDVVTGSVEIDLKAANSTKADTALDSFFLSLAPTDTLVSMLSGVVDSSQFAANPNNVDVRLRSFQLAPAREEARDINELDYVVFHGITDAPRVSVQARDVGTLAGNLRYGQFSPYSSLLFPGSYLIDITLPGQPDRPLYTFDADLSALKDSSVVLFASGFLDTAANQGGAGAAVLAALPNGQVIELPQVTESRFQVIHASVDPSLDTVDLYLNDTTKLDDVPANTATAFQTIDSRSDFKLSINLLTSQGPQDRRQFVDSFFLKPGANYQFVVQGVVSPSLFLNNPNGISTQLGVSVYEAARLNAEGGNNTIDFRFSNSATDLGPLKLVRAQDDSAFVDGNRYREVSQYRNIPSNNSVFYLVDSTQDVIIDSFAFNLANQSGEGVFLHAFGLGRPGQINGGRPLNLFAIDGQGNVFPLPRIRTASLKLIHVAPDPALDQIDVYVDGQRLLDDFEFQEATDFIDVPSNKVLTIDLVAADDPDNSNPVLTQTVQLADNQNRVLYALGVLNPNQFDQTANGSFISLRILSLNNEPRQSPNPNEVSVRLIHAVPDLSRSDFEDASQNVSIVEDLRYADPSSAYPTNARELVFEQIEGGGENSLDGFVDLSDAAGERVYLVSTGFNNPSANRNGPAAQFIAIRGDSTISMPSLGIANLQFIHNAADPNFSTVDVYINESKVVNNLYDMDDFTFREATGRFPLQSNRPLSISIAPAGSNSADEAIASFSLVLGSNTFNQVFIEGVGNPNNFDRSQNSDIGLQLNVFRQARGTSTSNDGRVNFQFHQGATDVGEAFFFEPLSGQNLFSQVGFGSEGSQYRGRPYEGGFQLFNVRTGANTEIASGILNFENTPLPTEVSNRDEFYNYTFFTSGFRDPSNNQNGPDLRLVAVSDQGAFVVDEGFLSDVQIIHASGDPEFDSVNVVLNDDIVLSGLQFSESTPFVRLPVRSGADANTLGIIRGQSTDLEDTAVSRLATFFRDSSYVVVAAGVARPNDFLANPEPFNRPINTRLSIISNYEQADTDSIAHVYFYNAITDAPALYPSVSVPPEFEVAGTMTFGQDTFLKDRPAVASLTRWQIVPGFSILEDYELALDTLGGQSVVLVAQGFLDVTTNGVPNSKDRVIYAYLANGERVNLDATSVGLEEKRPSKEASWTFYPNPAQNQIILQRGASQSHRYQIQISDMQGRTIHQTTWEANMEQIKLSVDDMADGAYILEVFSPHHQSQERLLIQR